MPKLKLTMQQVKENYKRDVAQRTKDRIEALTSETTNTDNGEHKNYAEKGDDVSNQKKMDVQKKMDCGIHAANIKINQKKMDVLICLVALLVALVALLVALLLMKNHA